MSELIYVVEDDENIREFVRMALESFSYHVVDFDNAEEALAKTSELLPDLIIMDIMLGGISGLEATKIIKQDSQTTKVPVILLSAKDTELDKVIGLDCGADDYIAKPFGVMELGARVRATLRRNHQSGGSQVIQIADLLLNPKTREISQAGISLQLTYKEFELLSYLVAQSGRIVTRKELLDVVWSTDFEGESRTLDMHIRSLRSKLGDDHNNPKYIKTARNVGYRFIGGNV